VTQDFAAKIKISSPWQGLSSLLNVVLYILALVGLIQIVGSFTGNETVQPFRSLQAFRPDLLKNRDVVLTTSITDQDTTEQHWKALQPTLSILWAINPDISSWMIRLNHEKRIIWTRHPTLFNWPVIASYDWRMNDFYFGPSFWKLSEGDKAAVIAHEYFHYKQNKIWMVGDTMLETLSGKLSEYGSKTEDEAHFYQLYAYQAMSMPPGEIVKGYFSNRRLYRFVLYSTSNPNH
jgi:hypothetical protein